MLDYVEGWYEGSAERMRRALDPDLAKRIVEKDAQTGQEYLDVMTAEDLINGTPRWGGCLSDAEGSRPHCAMVPKEKQQKDITIFDIYQKNASAKVVFFEWVDYLHLAKINGQWKIVNVLWQMKPKSNRRLGFRTCAAA